MAITFQCTDAEYVGLVDDYSLYPDIIEGILVQQMKKIDKQTRRNIEIMELINTFLLKSESLIESRNKLYSSFQQILSEYDNVQNIHDLEHKDAQINYIINDFHSIQRTIQKLLTILENTRITHVENELYMSDILKINEMLTEINKFNIENIINAYIEKRLFALQRIE